MPREYQSVPVTYLKIDPFGKISSKPTDKEAQDYKDGKKPDGVVEYKDDKGGSYLYKEYMGTDYGYINGVTIHDGTSQDGTKKFTNLNVSIKSNVDGHLEVLSIPLYGTRGLSAKARKLIMLLPKVDVGEEYSISSNKSTYKTESGEERTSVNIYFNYNDAIGQTAFIRSELFPKSEKHPDGTLPAITTKMELGKSVADYEAYDRALYAILETEITRIGKEVADRNATGELPSGSTVPTSPTPNVTVPASAIPKVKEPTVPNVTEIPAVMFDGEDDLPF